jgi:hypothetical protein
MIHRLRQLAGCAHLLLTFMESTRVWKDFSAVVEKQRNGFIIGIQDNKIG